MLNNDQFIFSSNEDGGRSVRKLSVPVFWKGGTLGSETDWFEPMNWYNRCLPGWFDVVVIAGDSTSGMNFPVINKFANDIAQLIIEPGGKLVIGHSGKLSIDGLEKKGLGILNEGEIIIEGELTIHRTLFANVRNKGLILNNGSFAIDKSEEKGIIHSNQGRFDNLGELIFL